MSTFDETPLEIEGTAEERTDLAWTRSGIALLAAVAVLARRVFAEGGHDADVLTVALAAVAGIGWALGILGTRIVARHRRAEGIVGTPPREPWQLLAVTFGTVALAVAGLSISVFYR